MKKIIPPDHWLRTRPIAHRGLHDINKGIPENSISAFEEACQKGFPIELDVRITGDGKAVVFHDFLLKRLVGINKWVSSMSASSLGKLKILDTGEKIPLLDEVLEHINGRVPVLIEIKRNLLPGIFENLVVSSLKNYNGEFAILTFNPIALRYLHHQVPDYISGINIGNAEKFLFKISSFNNFVNNFCAPQFISYSLRGKVPDFSAKYFNAQNLPILAWTVHSHEEEKFARQFADNIIFEQYLPE
ncbi:MAG TPA: glycerophosphodiester phosphodiesterase family protein [Candidatus Limnocylindrales bacterium]|nr:glycerophosphodiester phosphodiesterase family protein [Candidatus Limnocylindrales bacterium]